MSVLVIVERAHRGRVEQQYAHVLWLVEHVPDYPESVGRLAVAGVRVLVSASSLAALGLADRPLLAPVEIVQDGDLADVCAGYDRLWYL